MPRNASVAAKVAARVRLHQSLPAPERRRELRRCADLTLGELGAIVGVTPSAIHAYETGRRTPRGDLLVRYVEALSALAKVA